MVILDTAVFPSYVALTVDHFAVRDAVMIRLRIPWSSGVQPRIDEDLHIALVCEQASKGRIEIREPDGPAEQGLEAQSPVRHQLHCVIKLVVQVAEGCDEANLLDQPVSRRNFSR